MKKEWMLVLGCAALVSVSLVGCAEKSESEVDETSGGAERTGAVLDRAADRTVDAAKATGTAVKDVTGKALEKSGETLEKAGEAMEDAGTRMQAVPEPVPAEK